MEDRDIILKLNRRYDKDDLISLLNIEIGILKSEKHELEDFKGTIKDVRNYKKMKNERDFWMHKALQKNNTDDGL